MRGDIKRWGFCSDVRLSRKTMARAKRYVFSPISIDLKVGKTVIEAAQNTPRHSTLPFSEADILEGLDAHRGHADELAKLSVLEMGA